MNLILTDTPICLPAGTEDSLRLVDLSRQKIAGCTGCFRCWIKTPGKCVIRDDATKIYPLIAASRRVLYISRVRYGGYDTVMKTMLERAIPVQQAFLRLHHGQTHHVQRNVVPKQAVILAYGAETPEEEALFRKLVARNAENMIFESHRVRFLPKEELEQAVAEEVLLWERS